MHNIEIKSSEVMGDKLYQATLTNGLKIYLYKRKGYLKNIGMLGTKFGSINKTFYNKKTNSEVTFNDGIAHFLEHKLFEQEGDNALDLFAKMGVDSNAYTTFDHTVYYFETTKDYEKCLETLVEFVSSPYFTDLNVEKEKGIIGQEIKMYEDEPQAVVFYNLMRCLYKDFPVNIDILGTEETINRINKEQLYLCYKNYYHPSNMFCIIIGDVDIHITIDILEKSYKQRKLDTRDEIINVFPLETANYATKEITKSLEVTTPIVCMGIKLGENDGKTNIRNKVITEILESIYFSDISDFYEEMYKVGLLNDPIEVDYESSEKYSHIVLSYSTNYYQECEKRILKYLDRLKNETVDSNIFDLAKKKKIGELVKSFEEPTTIQRKVIEGIIQSTNLNDELEVVKAISTGDIEKFIKTYLSIENICISRVIPK